MGKLVVTEFVTLDGLMDDPCGGETFERGGWAFRVDRGSEGDGFKFDEPLELIDQRRTGECAILIHAPEPRS